MEHRLSGKILDTSGGLGIKSLSRKAWNSIHLFGGAKSSGEGLRHESVIIIITKGTIEVAVDDHYSKKVINSGEMILIPFNSPYFIDVVQNAHLMICRFHMEDILRVDKYTVDQLVPICENIAYSLKPLYVNEMLSSYLTLLDSYMQYGIDIAALFDLKREEFFFLLFSSYAKEELAAFFHPIISKDIMFKTFVMSNYLKVKNVQELAALSNYSTSGFIKKFMRNFNESPYKWMSRQRAKLIYNEIGSGITPLKEIAIKYNFSSYQHFAGFCKTHYGMPPKKISSRAGNLDSKEN